jgi:hypothetical protein
MNSLNWIRLSLVLLFFPVVFSQAQSVDEIKSKRDVYLWGEGTGNTLKRADDEALADLISQISVIVSSSFENEVTETKVRTDNGTQSAFQENVRGIISTYSQSALTNTDRIVLSNEPDAKVLRFIKREDVSKVFNQRKAKVYDFVSVAEDHEEKVRLSDALRYYNWALALLRSHPESKSILSERKDGSAYMQAYITERINGILEDVQFAFSALNDEDKHREITINCSFRGKPILNLDYSFWFGTDWSRLHSVKDGRTLVDFYGDNAQSWEKTNFKIEYAYAEQLFGDKELEEIYRLMDPPFFTKAAKEVKFTPEAKPTTRIASSSVQTTQEQATQNQSNATAIAHELVKVDAAPFKSIVDAITSATRSQNAESVRNLFTPDGFAVYEKLLLYGKARPVDDRNFEVYRNNDRFVARGKYMTFDFQGGSKSFVEEVVFHFDADQKVSTVAFGLGEIATSDIYNHPAWSEEEKFVLVDFLEQYKTAFALKRLDYLEAVFDDNAVIITGTILKRKQEIDGRPAENLFADNQIVQYNRFTKREYMQRLDHVFRSKDFVNIEFEDNTLRKSNANPNLFGIQIKQNYRSNNYGDQGYLFLLIDFSVRSEPSIHVRTWQPEKDPDGRIYGLEDF